MYAFPKTESYYTCRGARQTVLAGCRIAGLAILISSCSQRRISTSCLSSRHITVH